MKKPSFLHSALHLGPVLPVCLILTACMPSRFEVVASDQAVSATGRLHEVTSMAGRPVLLDSAVLLHPDCSSAGTAAIMIASQPLHGQVSIVNGSFYSAYPVSDPQRYACNVKKHPGVQAIYTPAAGYRGSDYLTLSVTTPNGRAATPTYRIDVQ